MAGVKKATAREAFDDNMRDAHYLVLLAESLTNLRKRRMRRELRERIGEALKLPARDHSELDCIESAEAFIVLTPRSRLSRDGLQDQRPLLRQALVAACAATETYLADAVLAKARSMTTSEQAAGPRLAQLPMTVGDWLYIEQHYERRRWGLNERILAKHIREEASTAPNQVGKLLALVGVGTWTRKLDGERKVARGDTEALLDRVTRRRNKIAHEGDRRGRSRATLTVDEVKADLADLESVVGAIERVLAT
ncbi:hypothetical protein [Nocardioides sp. ChNu-99]|uniref:hypothetical protein n=1 Tax=Nocardioides sp. ChNu-99 TaxID=2839897 RepID=UPI00240619DD|nr:hypothetical protein [Nocardioides sp. ChNu-99]MDF9717345.1 hypothetical protein [Nocardioides sp. ChNu-99]